MLDLHPSTFLRTVIFTFIVGFGKGVIWVLGNFYCKNLPTRLPSPQWLAGGAQPRTAGSEKGANRPSPPSCASNSETSLHNRHCLIPRGIHYHSTTVCVVKPPVKVIGCHCYCICEMSQTSVPRCWESLKSSRGKSKSLRICGRPWFVTLNCDGSPYLVS